MSRDRLVCAHCTGPVDEGRCSVCRASREQLQRGGLFGFDVPQPLALAALVLLLAFFMIIVQHAVG